MARYTGPGVTVEVIENKRIINLSEDIRVPAIVGPGPNFLRVTDEAVVRGSGATDTLLHTTGVTIEQVAKTPNISASDPNAVVDILTSPTDYTEASGVITPTVAAGLNAGDVYYVTYTYSIPSTQFDPQLFVDDADIEKQYGAESSGITVVSTNVSCGCLTVAGRIALENGAPAVYLCQASSGSLASDVTVSHYRNAIDKLEKLRNIGKVIAVFPSGSLLSQSDINLVHAYLKSHCERMSTPESRKERGAVIGDCYTDFISTGGHNSIATFTTKAETYNTKRVVYIAPTRFTRNALVLDGNYLACAYAGKVAAQTKASVTTTGMQLVGGAVPDELWSETEMDFLGAAGVTVIKSRAGVMSVRHALTTNVASAETAEDSVVEQENLVKRSLRTGLERAFMGKGYVIDDVTLFSVQAAVTSILSGLVQSGDIRAYGTKNNPQTGEVRVTATQDPTEPRRVIVACSYAPLYPFVWAHVTAATYVS